MTSYDDIMPRIVDLYIYLKASSFGKSKHKLNMVIYKVVVLVSNTSAICLSSNLPLLPEGTFLTLPLCYLKHEPKEHFTASLVNVSHKSFFPACVQNIV